MISVIETDRCRLTQISESDREHVLALYSNSQVREFLGGPVDEQSFSARFEDLKNDSESYTWAVTQRDNLSFIGIVSLDKHHDGQDMEISYQFLPDKWGKGFATEVVKAVIDYSLQELGLSRVVSETQFANEKSKLLLERVGMKPIKTLIRFNAPQVIYAKFA